MNHADYNADAICRVLGLQQFCDPVWIKSGITAIRTILKPSFFPEVIITLNSIKNGVEADVVAAKNQIWSTNASLPMEAFREKFKITEQELSEFVQAFQAALLESKTPRKAMCIDGMGMEVCLLRDYKIETFEAHVAINKSANEFVVQLIKIAWKTSGSPDIKNALRHAGAHVGLEFAEILRSDQPSKQRINMMVLATPEEREDFLKSIEKRGKSNKSQ